MSIISAYKRTYSEDFSDLGAWPFLITLPDYLAEAIEAITGHSVEQVVSFESGKMEEIKNGLSPRDYNKLQNFMEQSRELLGITRSHVRSSAVGVFSVSYGGVGEHQDMASSLVSHLSAVVGGDAGKPYEVRVTDNLIVVIMKDGYSELWTARDFTKLYRDILEELISVANVEFAMNTPVGLAYVERTLRAA